jgi:hypothetical protein
MVLDQENTCTGVDEDGYDDRFWIMKSDAVILLAGCRWILRYFVTSSGLFVNEVSKFEVLIQCSGRYRTEYRCYV